MSAILQVRWVIAPLHPPRALLGCSCCGTTRPFQPSGKARLNANGKRLDAWLIYKCAACDDTWNRPIFERQPRASIPQGMLDALQANDPVLLEAIAFDVTGLRRHAPRIETDEGYGVRRLALGPPAEWDVAQILLDNPAGHDVRLDRLLAAELGLSRATVQAWFEDGRIACDHQGRQALRRAARDGATVTIRPVSPEERARLGAVFRGYPPACRAVTR